MGDTQFTGHPHQSDPLGWKTVPLLCPAAILSMLILMSWAGLYVGHWPRPNHPDPYEAAGWLDIVVSIIQIIALPTPVYVGISGLKYTGTIVKKGRFIKWALTSILGWVIWLVFLFFAPGHPLVWLLD